MGGAVSSGRDNDELVDNLMRGSYIRTQAVERVFRVLDRADYMSAEARDQAYKDLAWRNGPLHLSAPCIYSEVMEALDLKPGLSFLNIGSGTGYLSTMVGLIIGSSGISHGVEAFPTVLEYANKKLSQFIENSVTLDEFDFCIPKYYMGNGLCLATHTYDRVYCGAGVLAKYENYFKQFLKVNGILVMPLVDTLVQIRRLSATQWARRNLLNVSFARLREPAKEELDDLITLDEQSPAPLQVLTRAAIRASLCDGVQRRQPELRAPPHRAPPPASRAPRRVRLPYTAEDEDLSELHDLDEAGGAHEMNALLSLVLSMGQNRAAGSLRFDHDDDQEPHDQPLGEIFALEREEGDENAMADDGIIVFDVGVRAPMRARRRTRTARPAAPADNPGAPGPEPSAPEHRDSDSSAPKADGLHPSAPEHRDSDSSAPEADGLHPSAAETDGLHPSATKADEPHLISPKAGGPRPSAPEARDPEPSVEPNLLEHNDADPSMDCTLPEPVEPSSDSRLPVFKGTKPSSPAPCGDSSVQPTDPPLERTRPSPDIESPADSSPDSCVAPSTSDTQVSTESAGASTSDAARTKSGARHSGVRDGGARGCRTRDGGAREGGASRARRSTRLHPSRWSDTSSEDDALPLKDNKRQKLDSGIGEGTASSGGSPDKSPKSDDKSQDKWDSSTVLVDKSPGHSTDDDYESDMVWQGESCSSSITSSSEEDEPPPPSYRCKRKVQERTSRGCRWSGAGGGRRACPAADEGGAPRGTDPRRTQLSLAMKRAIKELPLPHALKKYLNYGRCYQI